MTRKCFFRHLAGVLLLAGSTAIATAQTSATIRLDATKQHQHVTGFGGFVCSPQFTYGHMSNADINKVWGKGSTIGCNIMRLYIPIGENSWGQSLSTAKQAKQMGLILFASPWGQPSEWKTNNSSNATNSDGVVGSLKKENWDDYAEYLEKYVQYLRKNGVELDAISIQNEPDWTPTYAGCKWTATEMRDFVKTYGRSISCKIITPETVGVSDSYVNALNTSPAIDCFDIYGGHQYGGIGSAYKNLAAKGKEIWMTEYLINWNEGQQNSRNFNFSQDFFNFFRAINTCMTGDFNAWIHYAAKRFYAMLGDGQYGTTNGTVTKRGYVMAHFARFVTGMTRIDASFGGGLEGSAYLSQTGDTVVAVVANTSDQACTATVDLPFYTEKGALYSTTKSKSLSEKVLTLDGESCRPVTEVPAQSVNTVLFVRSRDRQPSNMQGTMAHFDLLDNQTTTKSAFGTAYNLSGKSRTFDSSNPLISSQKNTANGYLALDNRYAQLVMHINKVTTTNLFTSGATTLVYVNAEGKVSSHEYGRIDLSRQQNFDLVFDLSPSTLPDGCIGLISLTNDNASSHLNISFGDVYLSNGGLYSAKLSGLYVADDSNVLDYTGDDACTSLDLTACDGIPSQFPWVSGTNRLVWLPEYSSVGGTNLINVNMCQQLVLSAEGGSFRPVRSFEARAISFTTKVDGARMLMLPFTAVIPEGAHAYSISETFELTELRSVPPHTPVVIEGQGELTFTGSGNVSYSTSPLDQTVRGTYTSIPLYAGDGVLAKQNGKWGFLRLSESESLSPFGVYAQLPKNSETFFPFTGDTSLTEDISTLVSDGIVPNRGTATTYDLQGRRLSNRAAKGVVIIRQDDGTIRKATIK